MPGFLTDFCQKQISLSPPLKYFFPGENDFISLSDLAEVEVVTIYKRSLFSLLENKDKINEEKIEAVEV